MRTRPITRNTCAAASPWTLGNVDNTKNNDAGGATRRLKSELNQADTVVSGEYAAKLGEQLTPYKGDTINQRTLSETPGKRRTASACVRRSKEQRRHPVHAQGAGQVQPRVAWRRQLVQPVPQDRAERDRGRRKQGRRQNSLQRVVHRAARRGPVCRAVGRHLADRSGLRLVFAYIDNVTLVEDSAAVSDVASIAVTTQPTKTEYAIGDALDLSGMAVTATMSDGTPPSSARANTRSPSSTRRPPAKRPSR